MFAPLTVLAAPPQGPELHPDRVDANGVQRCGTPTVPAGEAAAIQTKLESLRSSRGLATPFRLTIPVAFHIVTCQGAGDVTPSQIDAQIRELNAAYRGTGFSFDLSSVDRTDIP